MHTARSAGIVTVFPFPLPLGADWAGVAVAAAALAAASLYLFAFFPVPGWFCTPGVAVGPACDPLVEALFDVSNNG